MKVQDIEDRKVHKEKLKERRRLKKLYNRQSNGSNQQGVTLANPIGEDEEFKGYEYSNEGETDSDDISIDDLYKDDDNNLDDLYKDDDDDNNIEDNIDENDNDIEDNIDENNTEDDNNIQEIQNKSNKRKRNETFSQNKK